MSNIKLRIAFDPTNIWDYEDFRLLIRDMTLNDTETNNQIEVYLLTLNTDTDYIDKVTTESGVETSNVFQFTSESALASKITNDNINIFLGGDQTLIDYINTNDPISLVENDVTGCQAITVIALLDTYKLQNKYVTQLQFWIKQILKYNG